MNRHCSKSALPLFTALTLALASLPLIGSAGRPSDAASIPWREGAGELLNTPVSSEKPILLRFTASWCGPCRVMNSSVWPQPEVAAMVNENFIPVEIDVDRPEGKRLSERYAIYGVPTLIILNREGKEVTRANFMSAKETVGFLKSGLK